MTKRDSANYNAEIVESYGEKLTAREAINVKMLAKAQRLDTLTKESEVIIAPKSWGRMAIHNDASEDKDYNTYFIIDKSGNLFTTGSEAFWSTFTQISEYADELGDYEIAACRQPSRKREGKDFITCYLV